MVRVCEAVISGVLEYSKMLVDRYREQLPLTECCVERGGKKRKGWVSQTDGTEQGGIKTGPPRGHT